MKQLDNVDSITIYRLLIVRLTAHVLESSILTFGHSFFSLLLPRCHAFIHISSPPVSFRHRFFSRHASKPPVLSHSTPATSMLIPNFFLYSCQFDTAQSHRTCVIQLFIFATIPVLFSLVSTRPRSVRHYRCI